MNIRKGRWISLWVCAGLLGVGAMAQADPDSGTRDAFISSRKSPVKPKVARRTPNSNGQASAERPLGVGYTLFTMNKAGNPVRVSPERDFHTGDALRLVVESNADGYLYVFNRDGSGPAKMIFPSPALISGANRIRAHVPYQIPSTHEDPERQWFKFLSEVPTREELCLIVTSEPISGIPIGSQLVAYGETYGRVSWSATNEVWDVIQTALNRPARETKTFLVGTRQNPNETNAITREIGLAPNDPAPSKVKFNADQANRMLVERIQLQSAGKR